MAGQVVQAAKVLDGLIQGLPDVSRTEQEQLEAVAAVQARTHSKQLNCMSALARALSQSLFGLFLPAARSHLQSANHKNRSHAVLRISSQAVLHSW